MSNATPYCVAASRPLLLDELKGIWQEVQQQPKIFLGTSNTRLWNNWRSDWEKIANKKYALWQPVYGFGIAGHPAKVALKIKISPTKYGHFIVYYKPPGDKVWIVLSETEFADSPFVVPPSTSPLDPCFTQYYLYASTAVNKLSLQKVFDDIQKDPRENSGSENTSVWAAWRPKLENIAGGPYPEFTVTKWIGVFGSPTAVGLKVKIGSTYAHFMASQDCDDPWLWVVLSESETQASPFIFPPNLQAAPPPPPPSPPPPPPPPGSTGPQTVSVLPGRLYYKSWPQVTNTKFTTFFKNASDGREVKMAASPDIVKLNEWREKFQKVNGRAYPRWNPKCWVGVLDNPRCVLTKVEIGPFQYGHFLSANDGGQEVWCIVSEWQGSNNPFELPTLYVPAAGPPSSRYIAASPPLSEADCNRFFELATLGHSVSFNITGDWEPMTSLRARMEAVAAKPYDKWIPQKWVAGFGETTSYLFAVQTSESFVSHFMIAIVQHSFKCVILTDCADYYSPFMMPPLEVTSAPGPPSTKYYASSTPLTDDQLQMLFDKASLYKTPSPYSTNYNLLWNSWRSSIEQLAGKPYPKWEPVKWMAEYGEPASFLIEVKINSYFSGHFLCWQRKNKWNFAILTEYAGNSPFQLPCSLPQPVQGPSSERYVKSSKPLSDAQLQEYFNKATLGKTCCAPTLRDLPLWESWRPAFEKVAEAPYTSWNVTKWVGEYGEPAAFCIAVEIGPGKFGQFMFYQLRGECIYTILNDQLPVATVPFQLLNRDSPPPLNLFKYYNASSYLSDVIIEGYFKDATSGRSNYSFSMAPPDKMAMMNGWKTQFEKVDGMTYPMWAIDRYSGDLASNPLNVMFKVKIDKFRYIHCLVHKEGDATIYVITTYLEGNISPFVYPIPKPPQTGAPSTRYFKASKDVTDADIHKWYMSGKMASKTGYYSCTPEDIAYLTTWKEKFEQVRGGQPFDEWTPLAWTAKWGEPCIMTALVRIGLMRHGQFMMHFNAREYTWIIINDYAGPNPPFELQDVQTPYSGPASTKYVRASRVVTDAELMKLYERATLGHSNNSCTPIDIPLWMQWKKKFESIPGGTPYQMWEPKKWVADYTGPTVIFLDVTIAPKKQGHFIMSYYRGEETWIVLSEFKPLNAPFTL